MSILSTAGGFKRSAREGLSTSAGIETSRIQANKNLDAQEKVAKGSNIGMGVGLGVATAAKGAALSGGLWGLGFALLANEISF